MIRNGTVLEWVIRHVLIHGIFGIGATVAAVWNVVAWWKSMGRKVDEWTNQL